MKNKYLIENDYIKIFLHKRNGISMETFIDLEDFEKLENFNYIWYPNYITNNWYCTTTTYLGIIDGNPKYKVIRLHRLVMDDPIGYRIDHIDNNTLNNRKNNLRLANAQQNSLNRKSKNSNNKSGYRNVCEINNRFIVQLQIDRKNTRLGNFKDVHKAGVFAEIMRQKYYGEFPGNN